MRAGLVSYRCKNGDTAFNMAQIERALKEAAGKADMLLFGEAFLQGFDSLKFDFETDRAVAVSRDSETMEALKRLTKVYGAALLFGYIEREGRPSTPPARLFRAASSCIITGAFPRAGRSPARTRITGRATIRRVSASAARISPLRSAAISGTAPGDSRRAAFSSGPCTSITLPRNGRKAFLPSTRSTRIPSPRARS